MSDSLNSARESVSDLIARSAVPQQLVGEITIDDLIELVSGLVTENIKEHLTTVASVTSEDEAEAVLTQVIEDTAVTAALIGIQATIQELGGVGMNEPDIDLTISPDTATQLLTALLRGHGITVKLGVGTES